MRTTITLPDEQKEKLLAVAAERGLRGCSKVVEDAIAFYLAERERPAVALPVVPASYAPPRPAPTPARERLVDVVERVVSVAVAGAALLAHAVRTKLGRASA